MNGWRQLSLLKGKRQKGTLPPLPLERKTHIAVADLLAKCISPGWLSNHIPSGEKRTKITGALLKRMGHKPGWADFVLMDPIGGHYYLELKRGMAPLSVEQIAFRDACWGRNVVWALARSYEEAEDILKAWGAVRLRVSA